MPLKAGRSKKVIQENIRELMHEVTKGDGKIGNYRPPNRKKAAQVAAAIAYSKAGRGKNR